MTSEAYPLTFGQLSMWRSLENDPLDRWSETYLRVTVPVPEGASLSEILAAIDRLCERHESLRTHFFDTAEGPMQTVVPDAARGDVPVIERPGVTAAEASELANELAAPFIDRAVAFGRRFAVVTDGGVCRWILVVVDHIVADGPGIWRMWRELAVELGADDPEAKAWLSEIPGQPRHLAVEQRAAKGRWDNALSYWSELLALPADLFPVPDAEGQVPGRIQAALHSDHARANLVAASKLMHSSPGSVLLALSVVATAAVWGRDDAVVMTLQSSNRYLPRWRNVVTSMNQYSPMPMRLDPHERGFAEFTAAVNAAGLKAYRYGAYDVDAVDRMIRESRGADFLAGFDNLYNFLAYQNLDTGPVPPDAPAAWVEESDPFRQIGPRFDIKVRGEPEMSIVIRVDPLLVPAPGLRALLYWYDSRLSELAGGAAFTVGDLLASCSEALVRR